MFTGIIEELGKVDSVKKGESGARFRFSANKVVEGSSAGDSIAINGVCLTALEIDEYGFAADVSNETLIRSTLGILAEGSPINLERAVTPSTRLGGHIVQGHVDGRGKYIKAEQAGEFWTVTIAFPPELGKYFVQKGSVSVEGISLTITDLRKNEFDIAVIPKTWDVTNLSTLKPGDPVNLEVDVIAKYVERLLTDSPKTEENKTRITVEKLRDLGFA